VTARKGTSRRRVDQFDKRITVNEFARNFDPVVFNERIRLYAENPGEAQGLLNMAFPYKPTKWDADDSQVATVKRPR
jgi:hypothetical protein